MGDETERLLQERPVRVLLVEDDRKIRDIFKYHLVREGYQVHEAGDGEEGIAKARSADPDVILMDVMMPRMDGFAACRALKGDDRTRMTPLVLVTALQDQQSRLKGLEAGADEFLSKPVNTEELKTRVKALARVKRYWDFISKQNHDLQEANHQLDRFQKAITRDLQLAGKVHQSLMPRSLSQRGIEVGVEYLPLYDIGGDYAQIRFPREDVLYLFLSDVTGHGIASALVASRVHAAVATAIERREAPADLLGALHRFMVRDLQDCSIFMTAFCARIDLPARRMTYANCGHPPAFLWTGGAGEIRPLEANASLLGVDTGGEPEIPEEAVDLPPAARILCYTDGLVETPDAAGVRLGIDGLRSRLEGILDRSPSVLVKELVASLRAPGVRVEDDVCVIAVGLP